MSHAPMLYDELTAEENLRYFASLYPGRACLDPAEALRQVGLDPDLNRTARPVLPGHAPAHLAGPRPASQPELLLLDEPFSNMDVESVRQMVELLSGFRHRTAPSSSPPTSASWPPPSPTACWPSKPAAWQVSSPGARRYEDQRRALPRIPRHPLRTPRIRSRSRRLSAITVARKIGMPPEQVFKTLITTDGHGSYLFAVIPGDAELDFKKLAKAAGLRKVEMAPLKDVQPLTGYIRGGVTVFGAKKAYPSFVDETAILFDRISVSAGTRGTQLILCARRLPPRGPGPRRARNHRRPDQIRNPRGSAGLPAALWRGRTRPRVLTNTKRANPDARPLDPSRQRPAHRVALHGRAHLHALLLRPGRGAVLHRLRSPRRLLQQIAGGVLCVATMFASVSALNQAWAREIRHNVMDAQRMAPSPGSELYLAKVIVNFLFVTIVQAALAPVLLRLLQPPRRRPGLAAACRAAAGHLGAGLPTASSSPPSP